MRIRGKRSSAGALSEHELHEPGAQFAPQEGAPETVFRQLLEAAPEAMMVFDQNERLMFVNTRTEELLGFSRGELLGRPVRALAAEPLAHAIHQLLSSGDSAPQGTAMRASLQVPFRRKDRSTLLVDVSLGQTTTEAGRLVSGTLREAIPDRSEAEVRLLQDVSLAVSAAEDLTGALNTIVEQLCEFAHWSMGEVWLPHAGGEYLECHSARCGYIEGLEEFRRASEDLTFKMGEGLVGRVWASGTSVWVRDVGVEPEFQRAPLARAAGLRSAIAIPALGDGQVVAVLVFFQKEERAQDEDLLRLITIVAAQLGSLILRKRAEEDLRRSEARFRQIVSTAFEGIAVVEPDGCVSYANERVAAMLGYRVEEILGRHALEFVFPEDRETAEQLLALRPVRPPEQFEFRLRRKDETPFWVIIATSAILDPRGNYTGALGMLTDINERRRMERALQESEQLFRRVLDALPVGVWIADRNGHLFDSNPAGRRIWAGVRYVGPEEFGHYKAWWADTKQLITPDQWAVSRAVKRGEVSLNEVIEIEAFDGTHRIILNSAMPLRNPAGEITGAIVVNEDVTEEKRLEAEQAAALARERRIANELQECFQPSVPPHLPGYVLGHAYRAALEESLLGGDFYDVFSLGRNRFGIAVGDVSGKGLDAAVHTVMAKYFLRGYAAEYEDPVQVVRLLNEALAAELSKTHFLTLFYGVLEAGTGRLTYVNAGHEPPLLLLAGAQLPTQLTPTGPLVGAISGLEYAAQVLDLPPGSSLLFYTDGVTDARRDREFLMIEGLIDLLMRESSSSHGQRLVDQLLQEVLAFTRGEQRDDITLLLVQRSSPEVEIPGAPEGCPG